MDESESFLLREKFAGKVAIQTEKQIQQQAVIARGNSVNAVKAQKLFFSKELDQAEKAFEELKAGVDEFEDEIGKDVKLIEKEVGKDVKLIESEVVDEIKVIEKEIE